MNVGTFELEGTISVVDVRSTVELERGPSYVSFELSKLEDEITPSLSLGIVKSEADKVFEVGVGTILDSSILIGQLSSEDTARGIYGVLI